MENEQKIGQKFVTPNQTLMKHSQFYIVKGMFFLKLIRLAVVVTLTILFLMGCGNQKEKEKILIEEELNSPRVQQAIENAKSKIRNPDQQDTQVSQKENEYKREQERAEKERKQRETNVFEYSNFTLAHNYDEVLPYNGIKMSFVIKNTSDSIQTVRLKDFILQKSGSNTILPEKPLRGYRGIARNPENPDLSDSDSELRQREMYPGDRFLVKIEFWEQRDLIRSMEGWNLVHMYNNNARTICTLHD